MRVFVLSCSQVSYILPSLVLYHCLFAIKCGIFDFGLFWLRRSRVQPWVWRISMILVSKDYNSLLVGSITTVCVLWWLLLAIQLLCMIWVIFMTWAYFCFQNLVYISFWSSSLVRLEGILLVMRSTCMGILLVMRSTCVLVHSSHGNYMRFTVFFFLLSEEKQHKVVGLHSACYFWIWLNNR